MNPTPEEEQRLEQLIDRTLRGQPPRRAPATLEVRVLAEIARRASLRWWQMSFAHWPVAARVALVLGSFVAIRVALRAYDWVTMPTGSSSLSSSLPPELSWIHSLFAAIVSLFQFIPAMWVYGGLTIVAIMYAALFGLSATAYRTLYASH